MRYNPPYIAARSMLPPYDERVRGFFLHGALHIHALARQEGFNLMVDPRAFMLHHPHPTSRARKQQRASPQFAAVCIMLAMT